MSSNNKVYTKNFLTMLSGNTFSQLIPFIVAPIIARLFTTEEFAVLANFMAIVGVLGIVATGRLELAIALPKDKKEAQQIAFTGFLITILLGFLSILLPVFAHQIGELYHDQLLSNYLWLVPLSVISYGLLGLTNNWNLRHERFHSISIGKISQSLINNGLAALLGYIGGGVDGLIIAWLISQYINIFVLLIGVNRSFNRKDFSLLTIKSTLKEYKDFPMINSLHAFSDIFFSQFLLFWIISTYFGIAELGLFAMMNKYVRAPIVLVSSSVSQLFYVEAGKAINQNYSMFPIVKKTLKTTLFFAVPFVVCVYFFGPILFKWYLGDQWEQAGVYAKSLTPILFFYFIISPISGLPILMNQQKKAFVLSVVGYAISCLGLYGTTWYGASFSSALWLYSLLFGLYNVTTLIWYFSLIKKHHAGII